MTPTAKLDLGPGPVCPVFGCEAPLDDGKLFCAECWSKVPLRTRSRIAELVGTEAGRGLVRLVAARLEGFAAYVRRRVAEGLTPA